MSLVNFAVVGCGHIGKRHAEMITRHPEAELVALVDINSQACSTYNFDVPFFNSLEELFSSQLNIDVINIATPNGLHAQHALQSLTANKHVVIEKPIALTKADAEKIIFKALQSNRYVFGVMQNRYSPPSIWIKEMIESGKLGKVFLVQMNCYWNRDERYYKKDTWHGSKKLDGGTLFTQFSHFIDILYWLFGDIQNIRSRIESFNHQDLTEFEDTGVVTFDFLTGGMGSINYSTSVWDKNMESSITIIAENGSIRIGGQYMDKIDYCHVKNYSFSPLPPTNPGNDYGDYKGSAANHIYIIENVINVIKSRSTITTNALEGMKVVEIIERIYNSVN
jgi:predicted dehydrogenase